MSEALRVFISSTFKDLVAEREAAYASIVGLEQVGDDMIHWSADERSGAQLSLDRVRESDVVVLILAHRYGWTPPGAEFSVTEQEFRAARGAGIPVLAFLLDPQVPWPPEHVDFQSKDRLDRFKALVEESTTRKMFRTPDQLAAQVTQAMALLIRRKSQSQQPRRLDLPVVAARVPNDLALKPDLCVVIGESEDGLPLLLEIRRSTDLSQHFDSLRTALDRPGRPGPTAVLDAFREAIEDHAAGAWTSDQLADVDSPSARKMYVSRRNLMDLTRSVLSRLYSPRPDSGANTNVRPLFDGTNRRAVSVPAGVGEVDRPHLESAGGTNRFLGIPVDGSPPHSVGLDSGKQWVSWHPFVFESLTPFAHREFLLGERVLHPSELPAALEEVAMNPSARGRHGNGMLQVEVAARVPRSDIMRILLAALNQVGELHSRGLVHGDLKPDNILITSDGPILIDGFDVEVDMRTPGWTPDWSSPEQVLGEPVGFAADIYSIGRLVAGALHAPLVGEVRRFRAPRQANGREDYDLFHSPTIHIAEEVVDSKEGRRAWTALARRCLAFSIEERPRDIASLAEQLAEQLETFPPLGSELLQLSGQLVVASLPDGREVVCRWIDDGSPYRTPRSGGWIPAPPAKGSAAYQGESTTLW